MLKTASGATVASAQPSTNKGQNTYSLKAINDPQFHLLQQSQDKMVRVILSSGRVTVHT